MGSQCQRFHDYLVGLALWNCDEARLWWRKCRTAEMVTSWQPRIIERGREERKGETKKAIPSKTHFWLLSYSNHALPPNSPFGENFSNRLTHGRS